jgi:hypothetical protein
MPAVQDDVQRARKSQCHRWFAAFFTFGATMCALTIGLLLFPGSALDSLWRLNPDARLVFQSLGSWSFVLMLTVGTACLVTAVGLWRSAFWATPLAIGIISINILGDVANAVIRHDYRALIGLPVGAAMIFLLVRCVSSSRSFALGQKADSSQREALQKICKP